MRFEVSFLDAALDGRSKLVAERIRGAIGPARVAIVDVYIFDGVDSITADGLAGLFSDPVVQRIMATPPDNCEVALDCDLAVEIAYRPGVTDPIAITARRAVMDLVDSKELSHEWTVQTARQYRISADADVTVSASNASGVAQLLHNPLIQQATIITPSSWNQGDRFPRIYPRAISEGTTAVEVFDLGSMSDSELDSLSNERLLALSSKEMQTIRSHFDREEIVAKRASLGLSGSATDVEIEVIAQTWSEHCKHKILNATIHYSDRSTGQRESIDSLFETYIRSTTERLAERCSYLRSVFHDNAGVIAFDDSHSVCFKVETHNSPSALDPYGGAITGIVGVNRDILGTGKGARPIFNTNVLCFADPETPDEEIPGQLLRPKEMLAGVHRGIVDGGNQSGIPVVAGAFLFDPSYLGKPLVFCGTGGILPAEIMNEESWIEHIDPGDIAVMVGGRIGKDGIHGATFSSLALDAGSPTSAVQIGDPITQKLMSDFLIEARDLGLFKGISDNGAGGLSSSLGEMAQSSGGVDVDLERCPLKYSGLAPWEIFVSESQERMSLAVDETKIDELLELADRRDVEATAIGRFTDSGALVVRTSGRVVAYLDLDFLHHGLPRMELEAIWTAPDPVPLKSARFDAASSASAGSASGKELTDGASRADETRGSDTVGGVTTRKSSVPDPGDAMRPTSDSTTEDAGQVLLELLSDPNISSKEFLIRQYDHEVQAGSVVKPFVGISSDAPSDGGVFKPLGSSNRALTVTHGVCPRIGDYDTYEMARCAVDEAYRAHIALGGDPDLVSALDNFCWPDPVRSESNPSGDYKLAQLVRACKGLASACIAYEIPLISGKDSMKNDAHIGATTISVRPTLLISLLGIVTDVDHAMTSDFKSEGDLIYLAGETLGALAGSSYERHRGVPQRRVPTVDSQSAVERYRALSIAIERGLVRSVHDCSDGGFAVALTECCIGGKVGARVDIEKLPAEARLADSELLYGESPSRFVVSVSPDRAPEFEETMQNTRIASIGKVDRGQRITVVRRERTVLDVGLSAASDTFKRVDHRWV